MGGLSRIIFVPGRREGELSSLERSGKEWRKAAESGDEGANAKTGFGGVWLTPVAPEMSLEWEDIVPSGPGFQNLGNTCFMNASLQCLLHCPPLVSVLSKRVHTKALGRSHSESSFCSFCSFESVLAQVQGSSGRKFSIAPRNFVQNQRSICKTFRPGRQEDAHEFVRHLLDNMVKASQYRSGRDNIKRMTHQEEMKTIVHSIFGGCLQNSVTCLSCKAVSVVTEPFLDLSVDIHSTSSVTGALEKFTSSERLDGANKYRCEKCRSHVAALKRMTIRRAPNILTLHLKRFDHLRKDSKHVYYEEKLDLKKYMIGCPDRASATYRLVGVLVHEGASTHVGHYYAYVRNSNGTWSLKDDESSSQIGLGSVLRQNAYILFYVRETPDPTLEAPMKVPTKMPVSNIEVNASPRLGRSRLASANSDGFFSARSESSLNSFLTDKELNNYGVSDDDEDQESEIEDGSVSGDSLDDEDDDVGKANGHARDGRRSDPKNSDLPSTSAITESTRTLESDGSSTRDGVRPANGSRDRDEAQEAAGKSPSRRGAGEVGPKVHRKAAAGPVLSIVGSSARNYLRLKALAYSAKVRSLAERKGEKSSAASSPRGSTSPSPERRRSNGGTGRASAEVADTVSVSPGPQPSSDSPPPHRELPASNGRPAPRHERLANGSSGVVFPDSGTWNDVDGDGLANVHEHLHDHEAGSSFIKRDRHGDEYDAEYDRGKMKKVKVKRDGLGRQRGPRPGAFDAGARLKKGHANRGRLRRSGGR